jgi:hypothetical protein
MTTAISERGVLVREVLDVDGHHRGSATLMTDGQAVFTPGIVGCVLVAVATYLGAVRDARKL